MSAALQGAGPRRGWRLHARTRLTLWYSLLLAGTLVLLGGAALYATEQALYAALDDGLRARAGAFEAVVGHELGEGERASTREMLSQAGGLDLLSVSVGFSTPDAQIPWGTPGFLAPYAARIRQDSGLLTSSAWGFDDPAVAERSVADGALDQVLIGKAHLANPHWSYYAATKLGVKGAANVLPPAYGHWLQRYRMAG